MENLTKHNLAFTHYKIRTWDDTPTGLWLCFDADDALRNYLVSPPTQLLVGLPEDESKQLTTLWHTFRAQYAALAGVHVSVVESHWVKDPHGAWASMTTQQKESLLQAIEQAIMKKKRIHTQ